MTLRLYTRKWLATLYPPAKDYSPAPKHTSKSAELFMAANLSRDLLVGTKRLLCGLVIRGLPSAGSFSLDADSPIDKYQEMFMAFRMKMNNLLNS